MALPVDQKLHEFPWREEWRGLRLKQILQSIIPDLGSRNALLTIRNGLVESTAGAVLDDADLPVAEGTTLRIDYRQGLRAKAAPSARPRLHERMKVVHDDEHLVVVSKQAGTPVQPIDEELKARTPRAATAPLVELLKHYWRQKGIADPPNPFLVQRLDLETSGLLVLAKDEKMAAALQRQLQGSRRELKRRYVALAAGIFAGDKGTWKTWIGRSRTGLRQSLSPRSPGKPQVAVTHFRVMERFASSTLLQLELETGRTHQIRIHCAEAGHPLYGERVYGTLAELVRERLKEGNAGKVTEDSPLAEAERLADQPLPDPNWRRPPRVMLHSTHLAFRHPHSGKTLKFDDPLPEDFEAFLQTIRKT
jgi:23S rRNA pseudouridine1911/1915/1917 synthase